MIILIFKEAVLYFLEEHDNSVTEYKLLTFLQTKHPDLLNFNHQSLSLYQKHFYLFYQLYKLKNELARSGYLLSIGAIEICLSNHLFSTNEITEFNKLEDFYLNIENINMGEDEVASMLRSFWVKYSALDEKQDALSVLGLDNQKDVDFRVIKKRFTKLALVKHPDRGGEPAEFFKIKRAYQKLKTIYS